MFFYDCFIRIMILLKNGFVNVFVLFVLCRKLRFLIFDFFDDDCVVIRFLYNGMFDIVVFVLGNFFVMDFGGLNFVFYVL